MISPNQSALLEVLSHIDDRVGSLEDLLDRSPIGIQIFRATGQSIYVNRTFREMFKAVPPPEYNVLRDEVAIKTGAIALFQKAFAGEIVHIPAVWYDPKNLEHVKVEGGEGLAIETDLVPVKNTSGTVSHVVCYTKQVDSEQHILEAHNKTNKELVDLNSLYRQLIDKSSVVMYAKDLQGKLLFGNSFYSEIFDFEPSDFLGKDDATLFPPEIALPLMRNDQEVLRSGETSETRESVVHADGTTHQYISVKFPYQDISGKTQGICGISTDISESLRMERELSVAKRMESLGLLASGMTHDFNNILSIVAMYAESLNDKLLPEQTSQKNAVQKILKAVEKAGTLTRQLRAFGRKQFIQADWIDLNAAIRSSSDTLRTVLGDQHKLTLELNESIPPVFLEPTQVDQILLNLCLNAKDALPDSGKMLVTTRNTTLDSTVPHRRLNATPGKYVELTVQDNGEGIDAETIEKVFEPFFTTKSSGRGTGLGLASVYGIMWHAGGDISLESQPGMGCTFHLYFPIEPKKS